MSSAQQWHKALAEAVIGWRWSLENETVVGTPESVFERDEEGHLHGKESHMDYDHVSVRGRLSKTSSSSNFGHLGIWGMSQWKEDRRIEITPLADGRIHLVFIDRRYYNFSGNYPRDRNETSIAGSRFECRLDLAAENLEAHIGEIAKFLREDPTNGIFAGRAADCASHYNLNFDSTTPINDQHEKVERATAESRQQEEEARKKSEESARKKVEEEDRTREKDAKAKNNQEANAKAKAEIERRRLLGLCISCGRGLSWWRRSMARAEKCLACAR